MINSKKAITDVAGLTLSAGIAYAFGFLPSSFVTNMIGEISKSLTADYVKKADYQKIKALLVNIHPSELNHDLQKIIVKSVEWSIKNIELLYIEQNKLEGADYRLDRLRKINTQLIKKVNEASFSQQITSLHQQVDNIGDAKTFFEQLNIDISELHDVKSKNPYGPFFKDQFPQMLKLCFGEMLKKEENRPALIAYEKEVNQTIIAKLDTVINGLNSSNGKTEAGLSVETIQKVRDNFDQVGQDEFVKVINEQYQTLAEDVGYLRERFDEVFSELGTNYLEKNKVYILAGAGVLVAVIVALLSYIKMQPFDIHVNLEPKLGLETHPDYPVLGDGEPKLSFYLQEQIIRDVTENGVSLIGINPDFKNKFVKVKLMDDHWKLTKDSLKLFDGSSVIEIEPNDRLASISGRVFEHIGHQPIENALIKMPLEGIETRVDANGVFEIQIPVKHRRERYEVQVVLDDGSISNWPILPGSVKPIPITRATND